MFLHKRGTGLTGLMKPKGKKMLTSHADILISEPARERGGRVFRGSGQGPAPSWALGGPVPHRLTQETGAAVSAPLHR